MKQLYLVFNFIIILGISNLIANDVEQIYQELDNLSALSNKVAEVNNFSFSRDVANFHLKSGKIYLLSSVNEKTAFAIFKGEGNVTITPSTDISKERLFSELKATIWDGSVDFLFLVFTDSTLAEFSQHLNFKEDKLYHGIKGDIKYCRKYLYDYKRKDYYPPLLQTLLNDEQDGFFYAHISIRSKWDKPLFFEYNPLSIEEVSLSIRTERESLADHYRSTICMFHRQEDYLSGEDLSYEKKDEIYVDKYTIDADITFRMDFSADCTLDFHGLQNSGKWLSLIMFYKLRINSVICENGDSLNFFKEDESFVLWVELPEKITKDSSCRISIDYDGDLIHQGGSVVIIYDYNYWYPQYPTYSNKLFDLTFHYPSTYDLISVGKKLSEEKNKKVKTANWVTKYPVNFAPFNMGKFKFAELKNPDIPTLNIHLNKNMKNAKADVANSTLFYESVYGECLFDTITVAEIPFFLSGQAFPGLINFYTDDFITSPEFKVFTDIQINRTDFVQLRAHEVAHQWWGCGVGSRSYHDKWLYEGLAEFSSIWFIQTSLQDNKKYFEFIEKWHRKIINEHMMTRNEGETECPMWLGNRAPNYICYYKGGWVFHMLRNLMMDLKTFDETKFKTMMHDFYETYKGSTATTEDFKLLVERHMLMDMDWFFDQWVYGNEIPKYKFDYDIVKKDDGKYYAKCKIKQQNVSENFRSYIPIEIDLGNDQKARFRTLVEGSGKEFEIPLPGKPKKIHFNIFDSVLSE